MKRYALLFAILGALVIYMAGCGQQSENASDSDEAAMMNNPDTESESAESENAGDDSAAEDSESEDSMTEAEPYTGSELNFSTLDELIGQYEWKDFGDGIKYMDVREGTGDVVESGDTITAYYTLWLPDGQMLETNVGEDTFSAPIDRGRLIKGWDMAVPGMKEGGVRRLIIPGELAYGANPRPGSGIPPNATLVFELMIVSTSK